MFTYIAYVFMFSSFVVMSFVHHVLGSKRAFRFCLKDLLNTIMLWAVFNLVLSLIGLKLAVSLFSLSVAMCLGVPGLVSLIAAKFIV